MGVKLLGKIKIHEIAKEVGLTSKEIIKIANDLGIGVTSHLSAVDDSQAEQIKQKARDGSTSDAKKASNDNAEKKTEAAAKTEETKKAGSNSDKKDNASNRSDKKAQATSKKKQAEAPVIIRREVIFSEEESKSQNGNKSQSGGKRDVGFVERTNKNDYNIVYRNKQTKPLTVSELFGLKPKETKTEPVQPKEEVPEKKEPEKEVVEEKVEVKTEEKVQVQKENKPQNKNK